MQHTFSNQLSNETGNLEQLRLSILTLRILNDPKQATNAVFGIAGGLERCSLRQGYLPRLSSIICVSCVSCVSQSIQLNRLGFNEHDPRFDATVRLQAVPAPSDLIAIIRILWIARAPSDKIVPIDPSRMSGHHQPPPLVMLSVINRIERPQRLQRSTKAIPKPRRTNTLHTLAWPVPMSQTICCFQQPLGPFRHWRFTHWQAFPRPPNGIAAVTTDVDAFCYSFVGRRT